MSYDGRRLYVIGRTEIFSVDLSDDLVHISSVSVNVSSVVFLSVNRDKIYYTDQSSYTVYCCKQNMEVIWSFKNEVMEFPTGITSDQYGNVYVACGKSNNVVLISADGKHSKEILNASNGLNDPKAIFYDNSENLLLVCNARDGQVLLCAIK